jgi:hypothetical protein
VHNPGVIGLSTLLLIVVVAASEWWRLRHAGPILILQEFRVGTPEDAGEFVYILVS